MLRTTLICVAGSVVIAAGASAQQPGRPGDSTRGTNRQMMMEQVRAADARLDRLLAEMNRATGTKKVEAMAAVINEMVAQRKQIRAHRMQMMERMHPGEMMGEGPGSHPKPAAPHDSAH